MKQSDDLFWRDLTAWVKKGESKLFARKVFYRRP